MGTIKRLTIYSDKILKRRKILTLSDIHMGFKDRSKASDIFSIAELSPNNFDYILMPGDIVHSGAILENPVVSDRVLSILSKITGNTKTFISLGNHDQLKRNGFEKWSPYGTETFRKTISLLKNITILDLSTKVEEEELEFSAINNSSKYYLEDNETSPSFLQEYTSSPKIEFTKTKYSIFLSHDPKSIYRLSKKNNSCIVPNTDLVVSGHMHNGFTPIWLQHILKGRGLVSPDYTIFPEFAYGTRQIADTIFLINGAVSGFVDFPIVSELFGVNGTIITLEPSCTKKLVYTYKG